MERCQLEQTFSEMNWVLKHCLETLTLAALSLLSHFDEAPALLMSRLSIDIMIELAAFYIVGANIGSGVFFMFDYFQPFSEPG